MRRILALFLLTAPLAMALAAEAHLDVHDPARPVAVGARLGAWTGPYQAPALGGHLKLRPTDGLGIEGFADHTLALQGAPVDLARHDHVIGFSVYTPALLGTERWYVSPTVGSCVTFRVHTPLGQRLPSNTDVLFGVHAGGQVEAAVAPRVSVQAQLQGFVYVGNQLSTDDWTLDASPGLHGSTVLQGIGSVNVTL